MSRHWMLAGIALAAIIAVTVFVIRMPASAGATQGDVNCSDSVDSIDALGILQLGAGLVDSLPCVEVADTNCDGRIDSLDALAILQLVAGLLSGLCLPDVGTPTPPPVATATVPPAATPTDIPVTPTPTAPAASPTPTPTFAVPAECTPWPPEIAAVIEVLPVPASLCFLVVDEDPPNLGCATGVIDMDNLVVCCVIECGNDQFGTILYHDVCHFHQVELLLDVGVTPTNGDYSGWVTAYAQQTAEGIDFVERTGWTFEGGFWSKPDIEPNWPMWPNPLEDAANFCARWYGGGRGALASDAPVRFAWAQEWLPE